MNLDSLLANWQAVLTAVVVFVTISLLLLSQRAPDMVMIGGVVVLLAAGVLTPEEALKGMSNEGMLTVAALFVVAAAIVGHWSAPASPFPLFGLEWDLFRLLRHITRTNQCAQFSVNNP